MGKGVRVEFFIYKLPHAPIEKKGGEIATEPSYTPGPPPKHILPHAQIELNCGEIDSDPFSSRVPPSIPEIHIL
jgi:hypothetical protein